MPKKAEPKKKTPTKKVEKKASGAKKGLISDSVMKHCAGW